MTKFVKDVAASLPLTALVVTALSVAAIMIAVRFFGLTVPGAMGLYFVIWWIGLFAILPIGVQSQAEAGDVVAGTEPGAPSAPALAEKAIWNSVLAGAVLFASALFLPLAGL